MAFQFFQFRSEVGIRGGPNRRHVDVTRLTAITYVERLKHLASALPSIGLQKLST